MRENPTNYQNIIASCKIFMVFWTYICLTELDYLWDKPITIHLYLVINIYYAHNTER